MASLHSHRKLANSNSNSATTTDTTVQTCLQFCHSEKNTTSSLYSGFCPEVCLAICPSLCIYPLTNLPLPQDYNPSKLNKSHNLSPLLISMLILLATTFLLIIFYVLYTKLYFHFYAPNSHSFLQTRPRSRRGGRVGSDSRDDEHVSRVVFNPFWCIPTVGLPATVINSIAVHKYGKEMEERDCAVCLAEFEEGDVLRVLPKCNHAFHVPCIDTWLSSHTTCPLCRAPIIPPDQQNHNHGHDHKAEDTSASLSPTVEEATEDNSSDEVLSISIVSGEEGVDGNNLEESMENSTSDKDQENLEEISKGSCSQRWSLERGAANLVTRSLSCSGKIFSSRSNIRPSPNL
ncbi:putative RING-H2 finger protein ATL53 [Chenopodium quinoa]|uniref:RING-type E3 ubiquitin transferase n=1 Tax=Chenopodium quinoa TaxID=63459 RepID=A0A803LEW9_CHEQI|nr:putative RING-H2 finger protein ATL53 [Chenopodium quinoa]